MIHKYSENLENVFKFDFSFSEKEFQIELKKHLANHDKHSIPKNIKDIIEI